MTRERTDRKIDTLQNVELGDGVEIQLRVAGPFVRSMALLIDYLIITGVLIVLSMIVGGIAAGTNANIGMGVMLICLFLMSWGYFAFFEGGKRGATPGKRSMGIRVVDRYGNAPTRGQVLVRNILRFVDMMPGIPTAGLGMMLGGYGAGLGTSLLSKKFQRIGDLVANTVVIYTKPVEHVHATVPPALSKVAPPVALTREEQAAVMAFRARAGLWSEARRIELADHASAVSQGTGKDGMARLLGVAHWLTEGK
ncbi:RDD family protein [Rubritalea tangerina]|uniref:RDD family protein n=1 Tax=Rubritalea tangerina TaxID=430798 RepID=A0ABW4Z6J1_9BACT